MTSIFIGNITRELNKPKFETLLKNFGRCSFDYKGFYCFVIYENPEAAEKVIKEFNNSTFEGTNGKVKVRIEYSHKSKANDRIVENRVKSSNMKTDSSNNKNNFDIDREKNDNNRGQRNESKNIRDHSRSRSLDKDRRKDVKDKRKEKFKERSQSRSREKYRDRSKEKDNNKERFKDKHFERENEKKAYTSEKENEKSQININNVCFICKLPGHFAKDCILTKDSCYECGIKGHIAKECNAKVRSAKTLNEMRVKAIYSQQSAYKYVNPGDKFKNLYKYYKNLKD